GFLRTLALLRGQVILDLYHGNIGALRDLAVSGADEVDGMTAGLQVAFNSLFQFVTTGGEGASRQHQVAMALKLPLDYVALYRKIVTRLCQVDGLTLVKCPDLGGAFTPKSHQRAVEVVGEVHNFHPVLAFCFGAEI